MFGDSAVTDNNEALLSYIVAAECEGGRDNISRCILGPSGPAIGGLNGEKYLEAACELENIIVNIVPKDFRCESVYEDFEIPEEFM